MKIGANIIFKNEEKVLPRMLNSMKGFIDGIYALDTGSTDSSIQIINDFIKENNLMGEVKTDLTCTEIIEGEECFIYDRARNKALEIIKGKCAIGFWMDCDEQLILPPDFNKEKFIDDFRRNADAATTTVVLGNTRYIRNSFFRASKDYKWIGAVHERLECREKERPWLNTQIQILVTSDGNSWQADIKKKYLKHALILKREFEKNNDPRDLFYWAASLKDAGESEKAIEIYRKRVERTDGSYEERYYSQWYIGLLTCALEKPSEQVIMEYLKSHELDPIRGEGILNIILELQHKEMWNSAYIFSKFAMEHYHGKNPIGKRNLFIDAWTYEGGILEAHIANCRALGKRDEINILQPKNTLEDLFNSIPSAWTGHREFASWLANLMQPKVTVELGVDYGYSLFSLAVPKIGKVYGIDHFEGDVNTGFRNTQNEVIENVQWLKEKHGIDNIEIIKGKFNEVAKRWIDKIDILHLDCMPIYDELKSDFRKWSSLLSDNSVVLFHNTNQYDDVKKFWNELAGFKYEFNQSGGLGVWCKREETLNAIKEKYSQVVKVEDAGKQKITFGYILHDEKVFNDYYLPSLEAMHNASEKKYDIEIIQTESKDANPAHNYNEIIKRSLNKYIVLTHTDVTFGENFIDNIFETIKQVPDFGALGIVGVDSVGNYHWSKIHTINEVETLDCCCIIINKEHGILFDEENFGEFHLYIEDMCCALNSKGLKCYTVLTDAMEVSPDIKYKDLTTKENFFNHHSATVAEHGFCWGRYHEFKEVLNKKWGRQVKTT